MKMHIQKILFCLLVICVSVSSCKKGDVSLNNNVNTGSSGSTARFAVIGNTLYTVSLNDLHIFDIADRNKPSLAGTAQLGVSVETIFPRDNNTIFVGSSNGMYIFDISNRLLPNLLSFYNHFNACDPVVANETHAFLTLSSRQGSRCNRSLNQLDIVSIENLRNPAVVNILPMTQPKGLGLFGDTLFVCDNGLKIFDITNPASPQLMNHYVSIKASDLIVSDSLLMTIGDDGLSQYRITGDALVKLSTIPVVKK